MIVSVHQPQYLPWLGYFDKIDRADIFIFLDDVQFKKNEWQNRNRIRNTSGWQWLTVPVFHDFGQQIKDIAIDNEARWRRKHLNALTLHYSRAPYFDTYIDFFKELYNKDWRRLAELNIYCITHFVKFLGIKTVLKRSSRLGASGGKTARLVQLCKTEKADAYLSGKDGPRYMDMSLFEKEGIEVLVQDFHHPVYAQRTSKEKDHFEPFMSVVDLLFNYGEKSLDIIRGTQKEGR